MRGLRAGTAELRLIDGESVIDRFPIVVSEIDPHVPLVVERAPEDDEQGSDPVEQPDLALEGLTLLLDQDLFVPVVVQAFHAKRRSLVLSNTVRELAEATVRGVDNGGPMKGSTMLATLHKVGVLASFSRPRVSDDNPYAEALFRTLKYRPGYRAGRSTPSRLPAPGSLISWPAAARAKPAERSRLLRSGRTGRKVTGAALASRVCGESLRDSYRVRPRRARRGSLGSTTRTSAQRSRSSSSPKVKSSRASSSSTGASTATAHGATRCGRSSTRAAIGAACWGCSLRWRSGSAESASLGA